MFLKNVIGGGKTQDDRIEHISASNASNTEKYPISFKERVLKPPLNKKRLAEK